MKCNTIGAIILVLVGLLVPAVLVYAGSPGGSELELGDTITVTDGMGREVEITKNPDHVICSGPGSLRLLVYLGAHDRIVAVDDMEKKTSRIAGRPYALANPQLKEYPLFGEFRGYDNPELIAALDPQPQVIFKTFGDMGYDPNELQQKTGIPVVVLNYGDLAGRREDLYSSIRLMANIVEKQARAEQVIRFFDDTIDDLKRRTADIPDSEKKTCFVGGVSFRGPHGFQSTEPVYPPLLFINAKNAAYDPEKAVSELSHADIAKEKIVEWDPEYIFVDLATIQVDKAAGAIYELAHDPAYRTLSAVEQGKVFGVLPYNLYTQNFGSILADGYFIGSVLYPDRFGDTDHVKKADEIYEFLVGEPVFGMMNDAFGGLAFERIILEE
ncbi:MAG TPA: iron ABC transporter substrate-binding protein [Spirochaetota bacterium]|nr:iron ABC transporter substrate-binding protein [Spirochaetota bacterium]